jgi:alpha-2-macroglobulin
MRGHFMILLTTMALACTSNPDPDVVSPNVVDDVQEQPESPPKEDIGQPVPEPMEPIAAENDMVSPDLPVEPRWYDPIPVESATAPGLEAAVESAPAAPLQIVPLTAGTDPFAKLPRPEVPELAAGDPRADTLRLGPEPPPEVGSVEERFPPAVVQQAPPETKIPPMTVVRHYPDGEIDLVDRVSVTFSHPMVPLADLAKLAEMPSPLAISPKVPGSFVWLGTDTVAFQPEGRMPFGNRYTATVKVGAKSALGGSLVEPYSFAFETPRPSLVGSVPNDGAEEIKPDSTIALYFNADVDPEVVLPLMELKDVEGKRHELKLVGRPAKDPDATGRVAIDADQRRRSRGLVVKPVRHLPRGMHFVLAISEQLTSTEGPLIADTKHFVRFATYYPLEVTGATCSWGGGLCYPGSPINIEFNNRLKQQPLEGKVTVSPPAEGLRLRVSGNDIVAFAEFLPSQEYTVHVSVGIEDSHGQKNVQGYSHKVKYREAYPMMKLARTGLIVLEARQTREIEVTSMNLEKGQLKLAYVPPAKLLDAIFLPDRYYDWDDDPTHSLQMMEERPLKLTDNPNRVKRQSIDLDPALAARNVPYGTVFIDLKARRSRGLFKGWDTFRQTALVQITDLGVTAALSRDELYVMATRLSTGETLAGAQVTLHEASTKNVLGKGYTDDHGLIKLPGPGIKGTEGPYVVTVEKGSDLAFLKLSGDVDSGSYQSSYYSHHSPPEPEFAGLVFSERGLYRPAEEIHLTAVARIRTIGPEGDVALLPKSQRRVQYTVRDPRWEELATGSLQLSPFGMGTFTVKTASNAPLGNYSVELSGSAGTITGSFEIQEYRTPEFEVATRFDHRDENILVGRTLDSVVDGTYYFGAPMNGASVDWSLTRSKSHYSPPGNSGFTFSDIDEQQTERYSFGHGYGRGSEFVTSGSGILNGQGQLHIPVELDPGDHRRGPVSFTVEAQVYDQNRQSVASRATILAHRAERCVGLAVDKMVVKAGETIDVSAVVTRLDGSRFGESEVEVQLMHSQWLDEETVDSSGEMDYTYTYKEEDGPSCKIVTAQAPGHCILTILQPGSYVLRATATDLGNRPVRSALRVYAYGDKDSNWSPDPDHRIDLVLDKKEYEPGDRASLLIQSPFPTARGLLTVSREGFAKVIPLELDSPSAVVELPIEEHWLPAVTANVVLVRGRIEKPGVTLDDRGRPAFANGEVSIPVARTRRTITVAVVPAANAVKPGEELVVSIKTKGANGEPIASNVAVMVVDEAVLSLIAYVTPNPLAAIYHALAAGTGFSDLRPLVLPRTKLKVEFVPEEEESEGGLDAAQAVMKSAPGAMAGFAPPKPAMARRMESKKGKDPGGASPDDDGGGPEFALREFFASTAYMNGEVRTGKDGTASLTIKMPDNLTQFRVMAIAANEGNLFGSSDAQVRTRRPLVVRPALPRFLNFGDELEAAAVVNNQTGFDTDVLVRCAAANATVEEGAKTVRVPHGGSAEVRFKARAGSPGPATFQFAAVALTENQDTDAATVTIPTLIPATGEGFATYGVADRAVRQPIEPPAGALPGFGGLDISLSSTALTGLQDAVKYLFEYPYECTEQLCSRMLPILALGEVLQDFELGDADTPAEAKAMVTTGLDRLYLRQRADGGFGYWPGSKRSWLYISAYAAMTLKIAKERGFDVREEVLHRALTFLEGRLDNLYEWEEKAYGAQTMAVLVLARCGRSAPKHLKRLVGLALEKQSLMTLYATAWLLEAVKLQPLEGRSDLNSKLAKRISNAAVETASAIHFSEARNESLRLMMHSEDRTDAIILHALLVTDPTNPMIEKIVRGLMRARVQGRWSTTQANAYALLALARYYDEFEGETPDFEARVWLGNKTVAAHSFKGREMTISKTRVPMEALQESTAGDLVVAKEGPGRLYYRLGLKYAPSNLELDALDQGFLVERTYLPEGEDGELRRLDDGTLVAKAGSYVRVRIRVVAPDRRFYVAVVDPLPAGLEAVNEEFATSATQRLGGVKNAVHSPHRGRGYWGHWNPWDFEERRDDRVQLFADRMYGGTYEYTYVARATTVGTFVIPPTRAEEMYEPETFGRSASSKLIVEE